MSGLIIYPLTQGAGLDQALPRHCGSFADELTLLVCYARGPAVAVLAEGGAWDGRHRFRGVLRRSDGRRRAGDEAVQGDGQTDRRRHRAPSL